MAKKQSQNKKCRKFVLGATKRVGFLQLAAEKKTPFLVQLKQTLGSSYFERALARYRFSIATNIGIRHNLEKS